MSPRSGADEKDEPTKVRFLIVGAWNTLFGVVTFILADATIGRLAGYAASVTLMFALAIPQAHAVQRRFVWRSHERYLPELVRFSGVFLVAYLVNLILLGLAVEVLEMSTVPAQVVISAAIAVSTYLIHRTWTFRHTGKVPRNGTRSSADGPVLAAPRDQA